MLANRCTSLQNSRHPLVHPQKMKALQEQKKEDLPQPQYMPELSATDEPFEKADKKVRISPSYKSRKKFS